jgi:glyoxylase-like metal-dependent hydrolase (beta-lactamase superfamily II)
MTRLRPLVLLLILCLGAGALTYGRGGAVEQASTRPPGATYKGQAFTFNKIAEGVYHAVGTGNLTVMSNATIIEGDTDVLVVDTQVSPGGAWALREELKAITPKPIRWVVNSHYHFDHSHGNQIYGPEVEIIGHEFARQQILAGKSQNSPAREFYVGGIPNTIKNLETRLAEAKDDAARATIQGQLEVQRTFLEGTNAVKPTPPTITLTQTMALHRGSREIRLLFLGRGHTAGDIVVHLPKERIIATGDLLTETTSYMGDAYFTDWIQTIEALKQVDFTTVLPGHGRAFTNKAQLDNWQAYLRDFWAQAQKFHAAKTPWEEAATQVDLRGNAVNYPAIRSVGIVPNHGMRRAYELLDGRVK